MTEGYQVPSTSARIELEIKKSRFIGYACRVDSKLEAQNVVANEKVKFPDARHHCWAYEIGKPSSPITAAMNDDGEPSGTAGKPILNVIQHKDIGNVMVVVVRYFGGIKLGAGGLVRAYSAAAEQAISELELMYYEEKVLASIECDFAEEQFIRHWLSERTIEVESVNYSESVRLDFLMPSSVKNELQILAQKPAFTLRIQDK